MRRRGVLGTLAARSAHGRRPVVACTALTLLLATSAVSCSAPTRATESQGARITTSSAGPALERSTHVYSTDSHGADLKVDVVRPEAEGTGRPILVLVHGGGFSTGSRTEYQKEAAYFARRGWVVAAVDYELLGGDIQHDFGDGLRALRVAVDDVSASIAWLRDHAAEFGADPEKVVAFGESAGGSTATALAYLDPGPSPVLAAVGASGRTDPWFYPQFDAGDAPMLFVSWDQDPIDDIDLERQNCQVAREAGIRCDNVVLKGEVHGLYLINHHDIIEDFFADIGVAPS